MRLISLRSWRQFPGSAWICSHFLSLSVRVCYTIVRDYFLIYQTPVETVRCQKSVLLSWWNPVASFIYIFKHCLPLYSIHNRQKFNIYPVWVRQCGVVEVIQSKWTNPDIYKFTWYFFINIVLIKSIFQFPNCTRCTMSKGIELNHYFITYKSVLTSKNNTLFC